MNKRIAILLAFTACAEPADELLPQLRSELQPGTELHYLLVETLDLSSDNVQDAQWLRVGVDCKHADDGLFELGSFSIGKGDEVLSRIRVTAFGERSGEAVRLFEQRAEAEFQHGTLVVPMLLGRKCMSMSDCGAGTTCDPATGGCTQVPRYRARTEVARTQTGRNCLTQLEVGPNVATPPERPAAPQCVPGDGICPAGCDGTRDADCRPALGEPCGNGQEACTAGTQCVHGVCCEQACTGTCERCDLPDSKGYCRAVTYSQATAPLSSPDYTAQCADHVDYTCTRGACASACATTHFNCDDDLQANGCETEAHTQYNCLKCGDACAYGYCGPEGCDSRATGASDPVSSAPVSPGMLYTFPLAIHPGHRHLRALGALVDPAIAGRLLRVAVYWQQGTVWDLFDATGALQTVDSAESNLQAPTGSLRVEARVAGKELPTQGSFKVAFQVSQSTQLFSTGAEEFWEVEPLEFGDFPVKLASLPDLQLLPLFRVYAITTP